MSWFGPEIHCVVISPCVDSKGKNWNNSVEYLGWQETVWTMETIGQSITSNPLCRVYGNDATHDKIVRTLKHFAGEKEDESLATNHGVEEDDIVFVFYAAHGDVMYRKRADSGFIVEKPRIDQIKSGIFSQIETRFVTKEIFSEEEDSAPLICLSNPVKYNRGIVTFSSGISLDSDYVLKDLEWNARFKLLTPAECKNKRYVVRRPDENLSMFSITIFDIPYNDGLQGDVPPAYDVNKQTIDFPLYTYWICDPDGTVVGKFDKCVGHRGVLDDGKLTLYIKDEVADPDTDNKWWSYLPPKGAYSITSRILTQGLPFTSLDLAEILHKAKTNMFFLFESCYSGGFAQSYRKSDKSESDKSVRIHTASDANNYAWRSAAWTPQRPYVGGRMTYSMFDALFDLKKMKRNKNVPWRLITSLASRAVSNQHPYFKNNGGVFGASKNVPAKGKIEFI